MARIIYYECKKNLCIAINTYVLPKNETVPKWDSVANMSPDLQNNAASGRKASSMLTKLSYWQ